MATGTAERKQATRANQVGAPPPEPEHLPCPRCSSTNTKFCYYNNYNFSQPRHFCKQCRRYWTHGGTLRDIPIGGGSRKNAKRSRTAPSAAAAPHHHDFRSFPSAASQLLVPFAADHGGAGPFGSDGKVCGSFTSLLNTQGAGLWALGGFGLGLGHGIEDVGFGVGRAVWPFHGIVEGGPTGGTGGVSSVAGNTWQLESGESGFSNGDCFTLPELAISTPGVNYLK